jgi:SAM-dependent methyltransferase
MQGPDKYLKEAWRVLRPGGIAYISVPYINLIRRAKMRFGYYDGRPGQGQEFYQYAFSSNEMTTLLMDSGFEVIAKHGYGSWKGISDEISLFRIIGSIPKIAGAYRILCRRFPYCDRVFGHMLGFICRKQ